MAIRLPDGYEAYLYRTRWWLPGLGTSQRTLQVRCRFKTKKIYDLQAVGLLFARIAFVWVLKAWSLLY